jgi:hypothetical protein
MSLLKKITVVVTSIALMICLSNVPMADNASKKNTFVYGNTTNNITNEGLVVGQGDWVYFSDFSTGSLYKMKTDGTNKKLLDKDTAYYLNIVSDTIYYCNQSDGNALYKIKTNGTEKKRIIWDNTEQIQSIGNWVYFVKKSEIYKYNHVTKKITKVYTEKDGIISIVIEGDWIYFSVTDDEASKLFKIKIDGTQKTLVYKYPGRRYLDFLSMCIENDWIYFLGFLGNDFYNEHIVKIKTDGTKIQYFNLKEKLIGNINVYKGYVYYKSGTYEESTISRVRTDGKNQKLLKKIKYTTLINIYNDIIWGSYSNFLNTNVKRISYRMNLDGTGFKQISKVPYPQVD